MALASSEESLADILARYAQEGFEGGFSPRPDGMVLCHACRDETPSEQVPLQAMHRLEGTSDPGEEMVVAALECPSCGGLGTLVLPYGPSADPDAAQVLANLMDDREHSGMEPGL